MSSARAERLVNLVLCLMSTRQFLSAERIRATVPGYAEAASDEAFFRMFERDKAELRELGVPLETGHTSAFDTVEGYRIARADYELGEIELAPDEATVVALAGNLWDTPDLAGAAHGALVKLRAAGVEVAESPAATVRTGLHAGEPALAPLLAATRAGRAVIFSHRRGGPAGEPTRREVEPWGVVSFRGRWYLVGHDRGRDDVRCFRLSRIQGEIRPTGPEGAVRVPDGVDLRALVRASAGPPPVSGTALVWVARDRAAGLRRLGRERGPAEHAGRAGVTIELDVRDRDTVARWLAGHGPDVAVLDPPELAGAVRSLWAGAAAIAAEAAR
ncbi:MULTISPECIES: helix-turn-helix transcriptional regulator [Pseudonocardia]|uniref:WYL domain-containing protein n=1 Tax=Pseudonocardia saturnea TaxID=33909 RepID=A0ABQ0RU81_9PSEU|nr:MULTISPECIES: WYL domain-containing protein [Pseudonocardia]BBG02167.1 WYL domain-containing protein [Pseudonocardia autotrophica]GEC24181.1 WYL domain-containing protein [Pseudonocardia saturnea]